MARKKKLSTTKKRVWNKFSEYIRLRDAVRTTGSTEYVRCISCDKVCPVFEGKVHAGHLVGGRTNAILFDERGCYAQCLSCNYNNGNTFGYMKGLEKIHGKERAHSLWKELHTLRGTYKKYTISDLEKLEREIEKKIEHIKN